MHLLVDILHTTAAFGVGLVFTFSLCILFSHDVSTVFFFLLSIFGCQPLASPPPGAYVCFGDGECGRESFSELTVQRLFNSPPCCIPNCGSARL